MLLLLQELMINCFYTFMLLVAAIVCFTLSYYNTIGAIISGTFLILAAICFGVNSYYGLISLRGQSTSVQRVPPPTVNRSPEVRSQPFTPPPAYNPPPSLAGPGPYTIPSHVQTSHPMSAGDLGYSSNRNAHYWIERLCAWETLNTCHTLHHFN